MYVDYIILEMHCWDILLVRHSLVLSSSVSSAEKEFIFTCKL